MTMKRVLTILIVALLAISGAQARRQKCSRCGGSGWYRIPPVGNTLDTRPNGTCSNCRQYVHLGGHSCPCTKCNGSGYVGEDKISGVVIPDDAQTIFNWIQKNAIPVNQTCSSCNGTGTCAACKGAGFIYMGYNMIACGACAGTTRCNTCAGSRVVQSWRPMTAEERNYLIAKFKELTNAANFN